MFLKVKVLFPVMLTFNILLRKGTSQNFDEVDGCIGNICFQDPSYPYREIRESWKKRPEEVLHNLGEPLRMKNRSGHESQSKTECSLCELKFSRKVQLMSILDDNNLKSYIMSTTKYPSPHILLVTCKQPDAPCAMTTPDDIMTRCIQKKTTLNLLTYNATSKEFVGRAVKYPSACECVLLEEEPEE